MRGKKSPFFGVLRNILVFTNLCCFEYVAALFLSCRKGLPGLQRGPRCMTTGPLLHGNGGLFATPGGPYGKTTVGKSSFSGAFSAFSSRVFEDTGRVEIRNKEDRVGWCR